MKNNTSKYATTTAQIKYWRLNMKALIGLFFIYALPTFACEIKEALITATVVNIQKDAHGCRTYLHAEKVESFTSSSMCPLSFREVSGAAIEIGLDSNNQCRFDVGDQMSGVLRKSLHGKITLE